MDKDRRALIGYGLVRAAQGLVTSVTGGQLTLTADLTRETHQIRSDSLALDAAGAVLLATGAVYAGAKAAEVIENMVGADDA